MKTRLSALILCGAMLVVGPRAAGAQALLFLDDIAVGGLYDEIIMDNALIGVATPLGLTTFADLNPVVGAVLFSGPVGAFVVNVSTGISKPLVGPSVTDLSSVDVTGAIGGTLRVGFADTGFSGTGASTVLNRIGGTTVGTVSTQYFADPANMVFAGPSGVQGPFGPGAFSGTASFFLPGLVTPFSISGIATVTHAGAGASSFDMETSVVPEPTSVVLLGAGFLGSALLRRRMRRKSS